MNARALGPCLFLSSWVHDERTRGVDPEHLLVALAVATQALRLRLLVEGAPAARGDRILDEAARIASRLADVEVV